MIRAAALVLVLVLAAPASAEDEAAPLVLEGAPAFVVPPAGDWTRRTQTVAPGQWLAEWRSPDGGLLRAHVFPVQQAREPEPLLVQAVDLFFRGLGVDGFGLPTRRPLRLWGCPAAQATVAAARAGRPVRGHARLLLAGPHTWAFAVGIAPQAAAAGRHGAVEAFVASLEPSEPRFVTPTFRPDPDGATPVATAPGEPPVTDRHVTAVMALLQAGLGRRFPLAQRGTIRAVLVEEARTGPARTREGFRVSGDALLALLDLEPAERDRSMRILGRRILDAILERASEGHEPAMRFAVLWREGGRLSVGTAEDGLTAGDVAHGLDLAAFLATLAADEEIVVEGDRRTRLHGRLAAGWDALPEEERKAARALGATWAALRYAWMQASAPARFAFRRAVAARLAPPAERARVEGLARGRDLMRWMEARPREGLEDALLEAALALTASERRALVDLLAVADAHAYHLGW